MRAIEVMLSSRVDDPSSTLLDGTSMRQVRERLSRDLSVKPFEFDELFTIFTNEAAAGREADRDIELHLPRTD